MTNAYERWKVYAISAGILNAELFAEDAEKAQTSWYTWAACEKACAEAAAALATQKD